MDCTIPENTEAITPEEREELKVSGEDYCSLVHSDSVSLLPCLCMLVNMFMFVFTVKLFLTESLCSSIRSAVDMGKFCLKS